MGRRKNEEDPKEEEGTLSSVFLQSLTPVEVTGGTGFGSQFEGNVGTRVSVRT